MTVPQVEQIIAAIMPFAVWPTAVIILVVVAMVLTPVDQRVALVRALAELVRAARGLPAPTDDRQVAAEREATRAVDDQSLDIPPQQSAQGGRVNDSQSSRSGPTLGTRSLTGRR